MSVPISAAQVRQLAASMCCLECNELPTDPVVLPCGDIFCFDCSFEYVDSMKGRKCPKCKMPCIPPQLRRCPQLVDIIENLKQLLQFAAASETYKINTTQKRLINLPPPPPIVRSPSRSPPTASFNEKQELTTPEVIRAVAVDSQPKHIFKNKISILTETAPILTSTPASNPTSELIGFQGVHNTVGVSVDNSQDSDGSTQSEHIPVLGIGFNTELSTTTTTTANTKIPEQSVSIQDTEIITLSKQSNGTATITQSLQPNQSEGDCVSQFSDKTEVASPTHFRMRKDYLNWEGIKRYLQNDGYDNTFDMSLEVLMSKIPISRVDAFKIFTDEVRDIDLKLQNHTSSLASNGIVFDRSSPRVVKLATQNLLPDIESTAPVWINKKKHFNDEVISSDNVIKRSKNTTIETNCVVTTSGLSRPVRDEVQQLCQEKGIPYMDNFDDCNMITHLVTIDPAPRTLKYCLAVVRGVWIVDKSWLSSISPLTSNEESKYEVRGDTGCRKSHCPAIGRIAKSILLRDQSQEYFTFSGSEYPTSLMSGFTVTLINDFTVVSVEEVSQLCLSAGAENVIVDGRDPPLQKPTSKHLIICDNRSGCHSAQKKFSTSNSTVLVLPVRGLLGCICRWSLT